jgi:hypothetical protein
MNAKILSFGILVMGCDVDIDAMEKKFFVNAYRKHYAGCDKITAQTQKIQTS